MFSDVRNYEDAFYPSGYPCRFESSTTQIRSRTNAELFELRFRARLADGAPDVELALVWRYAPVTSSWNCVHGAFSDVRIAEVQHLW